MTFVRGVQPQDVHEVWPQVAPLIERGLARQKAFKRADVHCSLEDGRRQLFVTWPAMDCALVTEISRHPGEQVLHVFMIAGRLPDNWRTVLANLEQWAADQGCTAVELRGRRGWLRKLRDYSAPRVILRKELPHA